MTGQRAVRAAVFAAALIGVVPGSAQLAAQAPATPAPQPAPAPWRFAGERITEVGPEGQVRIPPGGNRGTPGRVSPGDQARGRPRAWRRAGAPDFGHCRAPLMIRRGGSPVACCRRLRVSANSVRAAVN